MLLVTNRVYNNNTVLVDIEGGSQAIIQGSGVGYKKRRGDKILTKSVERIIYLQNDDVRQRFTSLLENIPIDITMTCFAIIEMAKVKYHYATLDYIYVTLTDHVAQMYNHLMKGSYHKSSVPDIQNRCPTEYAIATDALVMINKELNVQFPNDEVKSLALHFINAQGTEAETETLPTSDLNKKVSDITKQVFSEYGITRNLSNRNYFDRLMIHLQYLADRIQSENLDNKALNSDIEADFHKHYPKSFEIGTKVCDELENKLGSSLNENERVYFIIHIQRLIQEKEETSTEY